MYQHKNYDVTLCHALAYGKKWEALHDGNTVNTGPSFSSLDEELFIGTSTKARLRQLFSDGSVSQRNVATFYEAVRAFYERATRYAISNFPIHDATIKSASWLDFTSRLDSLTLSTLLQGISKLV